MSGGDGTFFTGDFLAGGFLARYQVLMQETMTAITRSAGELGLLNNADIEVQEFADTFACSLTVTVGGLSAIRLITFNEWNSLRSDSERELWLAFCVRQMLSDIKRKMDGNQNPSEADRSLEEEMGSKKMVPVTDPLNVLRYLDLSQGEVERSDEP